MSNCGVLYIATGEKYVKAGIKSALTVARHCYGLPIHLFTDKKSFQTLFSESLEPFSTVEIIENPHPRSKVDYMAKTPYDRTLYLDTDTAVVADIRSTFDVLDKFDFGMAHAMHRGAGNLKPWRIPLPDAYPEFNSGVVFYRSSPDVLEFLKQWGHHFNTDWIEAGIRNEQADHDQTPLRELLWLSDLRIATLPPEYNVRFLKYPLIWKRAEAVPKIYHLKQLHKGWGVWINKRLRLTNKARKLGLGRVIDLVKKIRGKR